MDTLGSPRDMVIDEKVTEEENLDMNVLLFCSSLSICCWLCQRQSGGLAGSLVWPSMSVFLLKRFIYSRYPLLMHFELFPNEYVEDLGACIRWFKFESMPLLQEPWEMRSHHSRGTDLLIWAANQMKVYRKLFILAFSWWHEMFLPFVNSLIILSLDLLLRSMG